MRVKCRPNGGCRRTKGLWTCGAIFTPASPEQYFLLRGAFLIYDEALDFIKNIGRAGVDLGLERMRELLDLLSSPDDKLKCVHIAGTNGKGSVSAYLTSVLKAAGYKVGTYNSPSVFCYNERWLLGGEPLCDDSVAKYMTEIAGAIEAENSRREREGRGGFCPTAFEIETALAFRAFEAEGCDVCVIETGLGGRWDATNAMRRKLLAVITPIGLDHCDYLGNTLGEIAAEKAAIINGDAVTCMQSEEVMRELAHPWREVAGERKFMPCRLTVAGQPRLIEDSLLGQRFEYEGQEYFVKMLGEHQLVNASIAICAAEKLRQAGFEISEQNIKDGLASTLWRGRFEIVQNAKERFDLCIPAGKTLIFDGAHNPHGAETLKAALAKYFAGKRIRVVMGVLADKDVEGIAALIAPMATKMTLVTPPSPRALKKEKLFEIASKYAPCDLGEDIRSAVQNALNDECDVVLLAGSLTLFENLADKRDKK